MTLGEGADLDNGFWRTASVSPDTLPMLSSDDMDDGSFRLLAENIPTLCWIANGDGYIVWYNRRWHDYCGSTPAQMEGWGWQSVHDPELLPSVMERWGASIATGDPFEMTFPLRGRDRVFRPFLTRASPMRDASGDVVRWLGINTEISRQVEVEQRLTASTERFRAAIGAVQGVLWTNTPEGEMRGEQPGWGALTGQAVEDYQGFGWANAIHPDDAKPTIDAWNKAVAARQPFMFEHRVRRHDGAWLWFSIRAIPAIDDDGSIREWIGVHTDITEQRQAEDDLRQLNETLEQRIRQALSERERVEEQLRQAQKMEAVGQLTGGLAHDFNNLLTIIRSSADLMRRRDVPDDKRRRYIDAISDTADRAAALTRQLLAFARRQPLQPERFNVGGRLQETGTILRSTLGGRIQLEVEVRCEDCHIEADPTQFDTAVLNLVVNARDAMNGEGTLTIAVDAVEGVPERRAHPPQVGLFMAVSISDHGVGIPREQVERIFEPFFTTKGVGRGTGLGLSQVFGFAKQSGGDITVESEPGKGTTFTLYLPRVEAVATRPPESTSAAPTNGTAGGIFPDGRCVLVVEDNQTVGEFAAQLLGELGYKTRLVEDGQAALDLLAEHPDGFDLVFSDVVMPGISGLELAKLIRRSHPDLPIVLTSGYSHVLAEEGTNGFPLLRKPYSVEGLVRILRIAAGSF